MLSASRGKGRMAWFGEVRAVERVHTLLRVADRHRGKGVSVVAALAKARKRRRVRTPWFSQYCAAIFMATSTATEPLSAKKTWLRSPGQ